MHPVSVTVHHRDGAARATTAHTARGSYTTPCFMPVGTRGAIKHMRMARVVCTTETQASLALVARGDYRSVPSLPAVAAGAEPDDAEEAPALRGGGDGLNTASAAVGFAAGQRPARAAWVARGRSVALHFAAWLALAETLHAAFGTQTAVIRALGGSRC
jgi:hypothetical protein